MLKGAIFDQDGILFDSEAIYQDCWRKAAIECGTEVLPGFTERISGSSGEESYRIISEYVPGVEPRSFKEKAIAMAHAVQDEYLPFKPGVPDILEFFKERGVPMVVASSSRKERVVKNLKKSGIYDYFDNVISGADIENGKPAPDIFLAAAESIGLDAKDCYVFEDSLNGVRAGYAAGCTTVMIPDLIAPTEEIMKKYSACCKDFFEVMDEISAGSL